MATMIQLRHVPDDLHRQLKSRAALAGMSLSEYLIREVRRIAERPSSEEIRRRIAARDPVRLKTRPDRVVREGRSAR